MGEESVMVAISSVPINHFDIDKPFYPLIMNYLILLIGLKNLAARGCIKETAKPFGINANLNLSDLASNIEKKFPFSGAGKEDLKENFIEASNSLLKLLGQLELKSEYMGKYINYEIDEIANELLHNAHYLIKFLTDSAGILLILAHEFNKHKPWHDNGPLWEFLRHCMNAAAHGGIFTFKGQEPKRPADWGHFRIDRTLQGTRLFKDDKGCGLLSPGDPIRLLWDIEQSYPTMNAL